MGPICIIFGMTVMFGEKTEKYFLSKDFNPNGNKHESSIILNPVRLTSRKVLCSNLVDFCLTGRWITFFDLF